MNLPTQLYFGLPVWAQNVLLSTYGISLRSRRYGGVHRAVVDELRRSQWFSANDLQAMQLARANATIARAVETVPWYRQFHASHSTLNHLDQLRDFPTLTKDDVRQHLQDFVSDPPRRGGLLEVHTGGTTGTPLTIYCDRSSLRRNYAFFVRLREWAGVPERARVATFAGAYHRAARARTARHSGVGTQPAEPFFTRRITLAQRRHRSMWHICPSGSRS